jgi:hypothetical protein
MALFVPVAVLLIVLRVRKRLSPNQFVSAIAALLIVDLLTLGWTLYRPIGLAEAFADGSAPAAWLADQPGTFRVYSPSYSVPQHVAQSHQLQLADGIDPLQLRRYVMFMQRATGVGEWKYSVTLPPYPGVKEDKDIRSALQTVSPNAALLGLLNVKYVDAAFPIEQPDLVKRVQMDATYLYENRLTLPRAFLVSKIDVADSPEAASEWLATHDVAASAVVEGLPQPIEWPVNPGAAEIKAWSPDQIEVRVDGPGWLVLSEIIAPDWTAAIDGEPTAVLPTDLTLRGVYVPWGAHTVKLTYQPKRVYAGMLLSFLSLIVCGAAIAFLSFKQDRRRTGESRRI